MMAAQNWECMVSHWIVHFQNAYNGVFYVMQILLQLKKSGQNSFHFIYYNPGKERY